MFETGQEIAVRDVVDGLSKTVLVVEAAPEHAVPWTKPEDIDFDPNNPKAKLGDRRGNFLAVLVDGSVHRISRAISDEIMRRLVLRNDGEPIDWQELQAP
jgi:hypothetical protein